MIKIVLAYLLAVPIILLIILPVSFFAVREVLYRSMGKMTDMSRLYSLTDRQAIIFNSIDSLYEIAVIFILVRWLYKKKYTWVIIASVLVLIIFFVLAHIEDGWRK